MDRKDEEGPGELNGVFAFYLGIGLIFSLLGGLIAFLVTYEEYRKKFPDRKKPRRIALSMAAAAFGFFLLLSAVLGLVLTDIF